jgi:hypothetical protein
MIGEANGEINQIMKGRNILQEQRISEVGIIPPMSISSIWRTGWMRLNTLHQLRGVRSPEERL